MPSGSAEFRGIPKKHNRDGGVPARHPSGEYCPSARAERLDVRLVRTGERARDQQSNHRFKKTQIGAEAYDLQAYQAA